MFALLSVAAAADFEHVLIIIADDLGVDKVSAYSGDVSNSGEQRPSTPTIDLLATAGVRFTDAWATPLCSPTRATLYSGTWPNRTGVGITIEEDSPNRLQATTDTLMQLASDAGLRTGLFGKWNVGEANRSPDEPATLVGFREYPIQLGFDVFAGNLDPAVVSYTDWLYTKSSADWRGMQYTTTAVQQTRNATDQTTGDAARWMRAERLRDSRLFSVVSYGLPHSTGNSSGNSNWDDAATACGASIGTDRENYAVAVECLDDAIGRLLANTPDLERTLVIFLADNGTPNAVAEGNFYDGRGKNTVYENGIRVPFIVADGAAVQATLDANGTLPSGTWQIDAGAVSSDPASIVDVFATVADLLDLSSPSCTPGDTCAEDSISLRSVLTGGAPERDEVWSESFSNRSGAWLGSAALRAGDMKLVVNGRNSQACRSYALYDLANDRWEETNLFEEEGSSSDRDAMLTRLYAHEVDMTLSWIPVPECGQ